MPTDADELRSQHQATRLQILSEDWEDVVIAWLKQHIDEDALAAWGPPDISANPLADLSRQLSTPGLYGSRGEYRHTDRRTDALIGPEGYLDRAGWLTKMQHVQYLTLGMGDYFIRLDVPAGGDELTIRLVAPHDVYVEVDEDIPDRPIRLWELRLRWWEAKRQWVYCWDQYDIGESRPGRTARPASYRVTLCNKGAEVTDDVSNVFLGQVGGFVGDAYPFVAASGKPVLPFVKYHAVDSGRMWNHYDKRGAARGTLNAALYWTYAGHAAKSASGKAVIIAGLEPIMGIQQNQTGDNRTQTIRITPGAMVYHNFADQGGGQPLIQEIGPGVELGQLAEFASGYEMRQAVRWGLDPTDVSRQSSSPTSGAALLISSRGKRNFSAQVTEVFRRADLEVIRLAAILLRQANLGDFPETGYSVTYHEIPDSPSEQADKRAQADWEIAHDFLDPAAAYTRWHPGVTEDAATEAILSARLGRMRLEKRANDAAIAEGLAAPKEEAARLVGIVDVSRQILADAAAGLLPVDTALEMLIEFGGVAPEKAERMIAPIRKDRAQVAQTPPLPEQSAGNAPPDEDEAPAEDEDAADESDTEQEQTT